MTFPTFEPTKPERVIRIKIKGKKYKVTGLSMVRCPIGQELSDTIDKVKGSQYGIIGYNKVTADAIAAYFKHKNSCDKCSRY